MNECESVSSECVYVLCLCVVVCPHKCFVVSVMCKLLASRTSPSLQADFHHRRPRQLPYFKCSGDYHCSPLSVASLMRRDSSPRVRFGLLRGSQTLSLCGRINKQSAST